MRREDVRPEVGSSELADGHLLKELGPEPCCSARLPFCNQENGDGRMMSADLKNLRQGQPAIGNTFKA
jgi:hypothetical protein